MKAQGRRTWRDRTILLTGLALVMAAVLHAPQPAWAAKLTCLTGTDPSVAGDLAQIAAVRAAVATACVCGSFDGGKGKTHANYVSCAKSVIAAGVSASQLRKQCKATVNKYYSTSTCGQAASKGEAPCIKTSASGKVTCSIKPASKCTGAACAGVALCIDAADSNHDGLIGAGDSGTCPPAPTHTSAPTATRTPTSTPAPTNTPVPRFVDNADGTVTDLVTNLQWEKKDRSGNEVHDVGTVWAWAGQCSMSGALCQTTGLNSNPCNSQTNGANGCALCTAGHTCNFNLLPPMWSLPSTLNGVTFGGHSDWRIPTIAELETIVDTSAPGCIPAFNSAPCVPPAFNNNCTPGCNVTTCSCESGEGDWSADTDQSDSTSALYMLFTATGGLATPDDKVIGSHAVRAVRGGK